MSTDLPPVMRAVQVLGLSSDLSGCALREVPVPTPAAGQVLVGVRAGEFGRRFPAQGAENRRAVLDLAQAGRVTPHVHTVLPLEAWRDAFALMAAREIVGRVVLAPHG